MARGIHALGDGRLAVELPAPERELLRSLPGQLRLILSGEHNAAGARARLFPSAYEDPQAEADYQELMHTELAEERLAKVQAFAETLEGGQEALGTWRVELDGEQAESWLSATNDARLVLGMALGITSEDQWEDILAAGDPAAAALAYLGWLQEELLAALSDL